MSIGRSAQTLKSYFLSALDGPWIRTREQGYELASGPRATESLPVESELPPAARSWARKERQNGTSLATLLVTLSTLNTIRNNEKSP